VTAYGNETAHDRFPRQRISVGGNTMTRQELDAALTRLGLNIPAKERDELAAATDLLKAMTTRLRPAGGRNVFVEPAHTVSFPKRG
jgi:hypothetical protein